MLTQSPTYRLFHTLWETRQARRLLLTLVFSKVERRASRVEIDMLLQMTYTQLAAVLDTLLGAGITGELNELYPHVSWKHITEYLCICYYAYQAGNPFPDPPGKEAFRDGGSLDLHPQRTRPIMDTVPISLLPLEQRLLSYGGTRLVYAFRTPRMGKTGCSAMPPPREKYITKVTEAKQKIAVTRTPQIYGNPTRLRSGSSKDTVSTGTAGGAGAVQALQTSTEVPDRNDSETFKLLRLCPG